MLKSYKAIYDHGQLSWLGDKPYTNKIKVIVVVDEKKRIVLLIYQLSSCKGLCPSLKEPLV